MKASTVLVAVAAVVVAVTPFGLGAQAQNDPQARPNSGPATPAAPAAATAPQSATVPEPPPPAPAGEAAKAGADTAPLTKEESDKAFAIVQSCGGSCHGLERFDGKGYDKTGWQQVLDLMGPNADLSKADTALVVRYLVINAPPPPKP